MQETFPDESTPPRLAVDLELLCLPGPEVGVRKLPVNSDRMHPVYNTCAGGVFLVLHHPHDSVYHHEGVTACPATTTQQSSS